MKSGIGSITSLLPVLGLGCDEALGYYMLGCDEALARRGNRFGSSCPTCQNDKSGDGMRMRLTLTTKLSSSDVGRTTSGMTNSRMAMDLDL